VVINPHRLHLLDSASIEVVQEDAAIPFSVGTGDFRVDGDLLVADRNVGAETGDAIRRRDGGKKISCFV